jgi:pimeloyl-ACP methyl ester carboxylesterase
MNEQTILVNGLHLNYIEGADNGLPLILIHGGSARWQAFDNIITELSANHHLFALDLRGHGKSGRAAGQYAVADYARDIIAFIHALVNEPPILFGHSLGGIAALMAAAIELLRQPTHIKLIGVSHVLHNENKEAVLTAVLDYLYAL